MICAVCFTKPLCRPCRKTLTVERNWREALPVDRCETCGQMIHEICGETNLDVLAVAGHHSFSCRHCVRLAEKSAADVKAAEKTRAQYEVELSETESEMPAQSSAPEAGGPAARSEPSATAGDGGLDSDEGIVYEC